MEQVVLVNEKDEHIGEMEKMQAHREGKLHRAVSVLIFNKQGDMLLQQRAFLKYHTPGLWTNACCTHPRLGENEIDAASRRLQEEMGITVPLTKIFDFIYKAGFDNGLTEYEFDHVFTGIAEKEPNPDPQEVNACKFVPMQVLVDDISRYPDNYTPWFKIIMKELQIHAPQLFPLGFKKNRVK